MISVGVAGGAGYTGGELLRIIINHPEVDIKYVYSTSQAGNPVYATHKDLLGETDLIFTDQLIEVDVLFLCLPHGTSKTFLEEKTISENTKIIDLLKLHSYVRSLLRRWCSVHVYYLLFSFNDFDFFLFTQR